MARIQISELPSSNETKQLTDKDLSFVVGGLAGLGTLLGIGGGGGGGGNAIDTFRGLFGGSGSGSGGGSGSGSGGGTPLTDSLSNLPFVGNLIRGSRAV